MRTTSLVTIGLLLALVCLRTTASDPVRSPETATATLEHRFRDTVRPFLDTYCMGCHGKEKPKGDMDLSVYPTADAVAKDLEHWELVLEQLEEKSMPPAKAKRHPQAEAPSGCHRLDPGHPQGRSEAERGRSRPGARSPAEQRRV